MRGAHLLKQFAIIAMVTTLSACGGSGGRGNNSSGAGDATSGGGGIDNSAGAGAGSSGTASSEGSNSSSSGGIKVGDQIMVELDGNVRGAPGTEALVLFQQKTGGVHGTVINTCASTGNNCTAWYQINWDSEPASQFVLSQNTNKYGPNQYGPAGWSQGWSAGSTISLVPSGDVTQEPDLTNPYYQSSDNPYSQSNGPGNGPSPSSTSWPLGSIDSTGYYGNCTWYAYGRMLELGQGSQQRKDQLTAITKYILPDGNNASQWITNARSADASLSVKLHALADSTDPTYDPTYIPQVGDIAAIGKVENFSSKGHVAVVESVNIATGTYTVSESSSSTNDGWNVLWRRRTINLTDHSPVGFDYFIHL